MATKVIYTLLFRSRPSPRWLSTAAATSKKDKVDSLYSRLTAHGDTEASVGDKLDEWVRTKDRKSLTRFHISRCVNQLRKFKKYHHAIQLYEWMERNKRKLNDDDRAILIDLLAKTDGIVSAEAYFNSLQDFLKTEQTYAALLKCYCNENMLDSATNLFEKMKELNFSSSALNYNNLMSLYLKSGHPEKVPLLAQEMEEKNVSPDLYTYNQLINSYASVKDFDSMENVMEKMRTNEVKCDWFTYANLAIAYMNAGLLDKASNALEAMEKIKDLRDREAFHTVITLYARASNLSGVIRAWESLKLAHPEICNNSYLVMLLALFKLGEVDGLEEIFREWESGCSAYNIKVANVIFESYLNRDMIEEANLLFANAKKRGAEPNLKTLDLFMNYHLKKRQMDLAMKYLETGVSKWNPEKNKWFPSEETVSMFLKYFEEEKDTDGAEKFCQIMKKIGCLNPKMYDSLLCTNIIVGKIEHQMHQRMNEDDIEIAYKTIEGS